MHIHILTMHFFCCPHTVQGQWLGAKVGWVQHNSDMPEHTWRESLAGWALSREQVSGVWREVPCPCPVPSLLLSSQATHLHFPLPPFSRVQAEKGPVNKGRCYATAQCPLQLHPTVFLLFTHLDAALLPSNHNSPCKERASTTPSHDRGIIISLLCLQPK